MMTRKLVATLGAVAVASVLMVADVSAQGAVCTSGETIVPDGREHVASVAAAAHQFWIFYQAANRSYSVELTPLGAGYGAFNGSFTVGANGSCTTLVAGFTSTETSNQEPRLDWASPTNGNGKRVALVTPTLNGVGFVGIDVNGGSGGSYRIRVIDTTLFSPAWTTSPGYNTYYSFFNTSNATITGTLTLTTTGGAAAGTATITIPAGTTAATNTASLAVASGQAGVAVFTHNGPAGAVLAEAAIANFSSTPGYIQGVKFTPRQSY